MAMTDSESETMVLYALVRRRDADGGERLLVRRIQNQWTFPPTKLRGREDLYTALNRIFEGDLALPCKSFYPERELSSIKNAPDGPRYPGLPEHWLLYPVTVSLTAEAHHLLIQNKTTAAWMTLDELSAITNEPNTQAIIAYLRGEGAAALAALPETPSMDARANSWSRFHDGGVRIVRGDSVKTIIAAGSRAFNLRVADPYLPYHRQGLGFTWSFFTPKDKQDLHVHGLPAVEIYGILEGRLQLWWKPMNARGVRVWENRILEAGDWAEVEPLHCHFAAWLTPEGLGTVIKAAGSGELAGVGRLGISGKTVCLWKGPDGREQRCSNHGHCAIPPAMQTLMAEYAKPFEERNYETVIGSP
jgi:hypothetical protein